MIYIGLVWLYHPLEITDYILFMIASFARGHMYFANILQLFRTCTFIEITIVTFIRKEAVEHTEAETKFVSKGQINNIPALVQIMAWRRPGDKITETYMRPSSKMGFFDGRMLIMTTMVFSLENVSITPCCVFPKGNVICKQLV